MRCWRQPAKWSSDSRSPPSFDKETQLFRIASSINLSQSKFHPPHHRNHVRRTQGLAVRPRWRLPAQSLLCYRQQRECSTSPRPTLGSIGCAEAVLLTLDFITQASKVVVLGAGGGIGQPLSLLLKLNPRVSELALYDIRGGPGVAADVGHINTKSTV